MAVSVRQNAVGDNGAGATSVSATWPSATLQGSLLVIMVGIRTTTVTPFHPTGYVAWNGHNNGSDVKWENAYGVFLTPQSGSVTVTFSSSTKAVIIIAEFTGFKQYFPNTNVATGNNIVWADAGFTGLSSGTGTTAGTTSTATSKNPRTLSIWGHACQGARTFSSPTNGFSISGTGVDDLQTFSSGGGAGGTKVSACIAWKELLGAGSNSDNQVTISSSEPWASKAHVHVLQEHSLGAAGGGY